MSVGSITRNEEETGRVKRPVGRPSFARARSAKAGGNVEQDSSSSYKSSPDCELINSLARGLQVLAAFQPEDDLLGNKDISARTGIPKPSVSRLTDTLVKLNFLEQDVGNGLYRLGGAAHALGLAARKTIDLPTIAQPFIERFASEHGITVFLGTLEGLEVRARVLGGGSNAGYNGLGADFSLDETALGLAYICGLEPQARKDLLSRLKTARGRRWPQSEARIEAALKQYADVGFCIMQGEWGGQSNTIGAPLPSSSGTPMLSICCGGPAAEFDRAKLHELAPYFVGLISTIKAATKQQVIRQF